MNKPKTKNYLFSLTLAFLLAFALMQNANANFLIAAVIFFEKENSESIIFADCEQTRKMAAEVVDKLIAQDFAGVRKNFNENMKQNLSVEQLKTVWESIIKDTGQYKSREKSLYQEYPDNVAVFTRLQMEKSKVVIEVRFGEDGKISGLWIRPA